MTARNSDERDKSRLSALAYPSEDPTGNTSKYVLTPQTEGPVCAPGKPRPRPRDAADPIPDAFMAAEHLHSAMHPAFKFRGRRGGGKKRNPQQFTN